MHLLRTLVARLRPNGGLFTPGETEIPTTPSTSMLQGLKNKEAKAVNESTKQLCSTGTQSQSTVDGASGSNETTSTEGAGGSKQNDSAVSELVFLRK